MKIVRPTLLDDFGCSVLMDLQRIMVNPKDITRIYDRWFTSGRDMTFWHVANPVWREIADEEWAEIDGAHTLVQQALVQQARGLISQ